MLKQLATASSNEMFNSNLLQPPDTFSGKILLNFSTPEDSESLETQKISIYCTFPDGQLLYIYKT